MRFLNMWYHHKYGIRPFERHSLVLTVGGLIYIGYGFVLTLWDENGPRARTIQVALKLFDLDVWAALWMVVGLIGILSARWPIFYENWGYSLLTAIAGGWAGIYLTGLIFHGNTLNEAGGLFVWALVAFLWWAIAGLVNPTKVIVIEMEAVDEDGD